jgi:ribose transport system substrate-binding protein
MPGTRLKLSAAVVAAWTVLVTAACSSSGGSSSSSSSGSGSGGSSSSAKKVNIAFFGYASANAYTQAALTGVKKIAAEHGATVHFFDPNMNSTTQVSQIEDAATSGKYNAMVVYSVDGGAVVNAVHQALQNSIKVSADFVPVGPDIDTTATQVHGIVGSAVVPIDQTGTDAGNLIVQACQNVNPCRVAYLPGDNTLPLEIDRTKHVMAVVKQHPDIQVVATVQSGYASGTGETAGQNVLTAHPNVNVIASSNDQAIVGVALALKQKGDLGKIKLIGGGGTYQAVAGIKNGTWFGTVNYCPTSEAEAATKMVINAVQGKPVGPAAINSLTICGAPQDLTKANLGSYPGQWSAG